MITNIFIITRFFFIVQPLKSCILFWFLFKYVLNAQFRRVQQLLKAGDSFKIIYFTMKICRCCFSKSQCYHVGISSAAFVMAVSIGRGLPMFIICNELMHLSLSLALPNLKLQLFWVMWFHNDKIYSYQSSFKLGCSLTAKNCPFPIGRVNIWTSSLKCRYFLCGVLLLQEMQVNEGVTYLMKVRKPKNWSFTNFFLKLTFE